MAVAVRTRLVHRPALVGGGVRYSQAWGQARSRSQVIYSAVQHRQSDSWLREDESARSAPDLSP